MKETIIIRAAIIAAKRQAAGIARAKERVLTAFEGKKPLRDSELKSIFGNFEDLFMFDSERRQLLVVNPDKLARFGQVHHKDDEINACLLCQFIGRETLKRLKKDLPVYW